MRRPRALLFVCKSNSVRSPMAAALASNYLQSDIFVDSAGLEAARINPFAVAVMAELDIDLSAHAGKTITDIVPGKFDIVISLTGEVDRYVRESLRNAGTIFDVWPIEDPAQALEQGRSRDQVLSAFRDVREDLATRIRLGFSLKSEG